MNRRIVSSTIATVACLLALLAGGCRKDAPTEPAWPQPPATPTGFTATAVADSQINLSWNAPQGAESYWLGTGPSWIIVIAPQTTYSWATDLSPGTEYCFTITACRHAPPENPGLGNLCSAGATACATTLPGP